MTLSILSCIANDLDTVFEQFYRRMLSNDDFAHFFSSKSQVEELIEKQKAYFILSLSKPFDELREVYIALGQMHYDIKLPFVDFSAAMTILEEYILGIASRKPDSEKVIEAAFSFFRMIRGFTAKGYLNRMLATDSADIDLYIENVQRSTEVDTSFATERLLWLRQLLYAIQIEDRAAAPPMQLPPAIMQSIKDTIAKDTALMRYIKDTLSRIEIDATNVFYFLEKQSYEEVLSLYRELMNIYKLSLMLTNVITIASSNTLITTLNRDALTGLLTRSSLSAIIASELAIAATSNYPISLVVCDIDHFKNINDTYGHNCGDEVLKGFATILKKSVRSTDFAFRYGGEEFLLVLRGASEEISANLAEYVRKEIEDTVFTLEGKPVTVTASFGVATFRSPFSESFGEMFKLADGKLYQSKRDGRNRITR